MLNQITTQHQPTTVAWYGVDDVAVVEFAYRLVDADHVQLVATLNQTDTATGQCISFILADQIEEADYAPDTACDIEHDARTVIDEMGVIAVSTGRFSETVAAAIDRAAQVPAIAAE
jgi:hypothetical protein